MEETQRQKKIAGVIQKDMADVLQRAATDGGLKGLLISVSKVKRHYRPFHCKSVFEYFSRRPRQRNVRGHTVQPALN
jgi:ribosome-binding factor A